LFTRPNPQCAEGILFEDEGEGGSIHFHILWYFWSFKHSRIFFFHLSFVFLLVHSTSASLPL
jgi:hypothetical protein